jgi:hypothetical protein
MMNMSSAIELVWAGARVEKEHTDDLTGVYADETASVTGQMP